MHHSNEIAQTQARYGARLANYWMHAAFLRVDEAKMAKSSGEFLRLAILADRGYEALAYRYLCLGAHYRGPLNFTWDGLDAAAIGLNRLRKAYRDAQGEGEPDDRAVAEFRAAVGNDLNVPKALAIAWSVARGSLSPGVRRATLALFDEVLGLDLNVVSRSAQVPDAVMALLGRREDARRVKDWAQADALRDEIFAAGYEIADSPEGVGLRSRAISR